MLARRASDTRSGLVATLAESLVGVRPGDSRSEGAVGARLLRYSSLARDVELACSALDVALSLTAEESDLMLFLNSLGGDTADALLSLLGDH